MNAPAWSRALVHTARKGPRPAGVAVPVPRRAPGIPPECPRPAWAAVAAVLPSNALFRVVRPLFCPLFCPLPGGYGRVTRASPASRVIGAFGSGPAARPAVRGVTIRADTRRSSISAAAASTAAATSAIPRGTTVAPLPVGCGNISGRHGRPPGRQCGNLAPPDRLASRGA